METKELTIEEIAEKISKTRKIVTIPKHQLNFLNRYLVENYKEFKCQFMIIGEKVHITRKCKFIKL